MRILITGGAGFVGSHIAESWQGKAEILVLDNLRSGFTKNLSCLEAKFIQGDIINAALVEELCAGVDIIYHEAALVSVIESIREPRLTEEINVIGLLNVLEAAKKNRVKRVIFASSAAVYGNLNSGLQTETMLPCPMSPYATSKVAGEHYVKIYSLLHQVSGVCLRNFNIFGPRQDPSSPYASVIPIFINKALKNQDLVIYGDGCQTRDFIYVKDVAAANVWSGTNQVQDVLNIASGCSMTIRELAEMIVEMTGSSSRIVNVPARTGEVRFSTADTTLATKAGFTTKWDLKTALQETIRYYAENV